MGSLRLHCACCKSPYTLRHSFYHQLCPRCAEVNWAKRSQSAPMHGMVALVTGGRVRIGFCIALKLLRAGARVLVTSRYPNDTALRYAREADHAEWCGRLEVFGPLELADVGAVEAFAAAVGQRYKRVHVRAASRLPSAAFHRHPLSTAFHRLRSPSTAFHRFGRLPPLPPPYIRVTSAFDRLRLPFTAFDRLRLPFTAFDRLRPHSTAFDCLPPPSTAFDRLRPPSIAFDRRLAHAAACAHAAGADH